MKRLYFLLVLAALSSVFVLVQSGRVSAANGVNFKAGRIIDDSTFTNKNSMNIQMIQAFLDSKVPTCDTNGTQSIYDPTYGDTVTRAVYSQRRGINPPFTCLRHYAENSKGSAQIIWEAAQDYAINPQVLIVLLQKEQGLVTDTWPWPIQYRSATGYGCPDTAACDTQYYGFTNQVRNAARMFRLIMDDARVNYYPPGARSVRWSPNSACGSSTVVIENRATSALYNYTPYQPNQAALNNLYSTGDGCSAYGNRNFWRDFTDWFGPTTGQGFTVVIPDNGDTRQWVVYGSIRQHIPSAEVKVAWGLDSVPLITMNSNVVASIPEGPPLDILMRHGNTPNVYLVDGGKRYWIRDAHMLASWGLSGRTISAVSTDLYLHPTDQGVLTYSVKTASNPALYMVDGVNGSGQVVLRQYLYPNTFTAWEGDTAPFTIISDTLFDQMDNAIGTGLSTTKITYEGNEYQVVAGQRLLQPASIAGLFPGVAQSVSSYTFARLVQSADASQYIRAAGDPKVYLVDSGQRHHVTDGNLIRAWGVGANPPVNIVSAGYVNLLEEGDALSGFVGENSGGQLYLFDGRKIPIPSSLDTAYRTSIVFTASDTLLNLLPTSADAKPLLKSFDQPHIYMMEQSTRRHVTTSIDFGLWSDSAYTFTPASYYVVDSFSQGNTVGSYITDGTTDYLVNGNNKHSVSASVASAWGLSSPSTVHSSTLNRLGNGSALTAEAKVGSTYYFMNSGTAYAATDVNLAGVWQVDDAPGLNATMVSKVPAVAPLKRFVRSVDTSDHRIFTVNNAQLYYVGTPQMVWNLGYDGGAMMSLAAAGITTLDSGSTWTSPIVKNGSGTFYIIDNGVKRAFADTTTSNQWTNSGSLSVVTVSDSFLNMFSAGSSVTKSIKGSVPNVYAGINGNKQWVTSGSTYSASYAPFTQVSDNLVDALPTGSNIP